MVEKPVYVITFNSSNTSTLLYKLLKANRLSIYMIQTPCFLSAGCARSIEIKENEIEKAIDLIQCNDIDVKAIHKKYVNLETRRYIYEEISF